VLQPGSWILQGDSRNPGVTELLPIDLNTKSEPSSLAPGEGMDEPGDLITAPPVGWLRWDAEVPGGWLSLPPEGDRSLPPITPLAPDGEPLAAEADGRWRWTDQRPTEVTVVWDEQGPCKAAIPIVDAEGRIAAAALPSLSLDDVWWDLVDFPSAREDDDREGEDLDDADGVNGTTAAAGTAAQNDEAHATPVRGMMHLIEQIADRQTGLDEQDWRFWCQRLQSTLLRVPPTELEAIRSIGLNPLTALRATPFRPDFACGDSKSAKDYDDMLDQIETAWQMTDLEPIGAPE
jgi:hypothetical protein